MPLHWHSHPTQELSQCLGLRQACLATSSGPRHTRENAAEGDKCSFYRCGMFILSFFFSYGTCLEG